MSAITSIQWTDRTWNPTTGCTRVSPGCDHCYAFQLHDQRYIAKRAGKAVNGAQYDQPFSTVQLLPSRLDEPLHWRKPARVFVDSMSDLFHEDVPDEYLDRVFTVMATAREHTFQVLTKRPERMRDYMLSWVTAERGDGTWRNPLPNVWLGVSVEDQQRADERIPLLLDTPAAVRFISAEPLLGPLDLVPYLHGDTTLNWVIVGGESGPRARPFQLEWARSIKAQCIGFEVAFFMKQVGSRCHNPGGGVTYKHPHGGDIEEWPLDLRMREFPK